MTTKVLISNDLFQPSSFSRNFLLTFRNTWRFHGIFLDTYGVFSHFLFTFGSAGLRSAFKKQHEEMRETERDLEKRKTDNFLKNLFQWLLVISGFVNNCRRTSSHVLPFLATRGALYSWQREAPVCVWLAFLGDDFTTWFSCQQSPKEPWKRRDDIRSRGKIHINLLDKFSPHKKLSSSAASLV